MNARDKKLNLVLQYINSDKFSPSMFAETYKISEFNEDEKEKIASALFLKIKSGENSLAVDTVLLASVHNKLEKSSHWYSYFSDKQKINKFDKAAAGFIINNRVILSNTLQLAIDYGSEEARAYKLQHNISNNNNNSSSLVSVPKKK